MNNTKTGTDHQQIKKPENQILVIFGASGDLTIRKLIPALYDLHIKDLLPDSFAILGVGRSEYSDDSFRERMKKGIEEYSGLEAGEMKDKDAFCKTLFYQQLDTSKSEDYSRLKDRLKKLDSELNAGGNFIYYLSTPPSLYETIPYALAEYDLNSSTVFPGFKRLIVEKPFGYDLESARELNANLRVIFHENQIYRIDHYLGKETVQNLLVTRFSNGIFEPLWNRNYIQHVEITSVEDLGIGSRGGYYDNSGALRDMVQNHLLQLVGLVAMEPPAVVDASSIRNETLKVFQSLRPLTKEDLVNNVIRGQYISSTVRGEKVNGYREEEGVPADSRTETYVAMKFFIDNWRWAGVPFYIRTGKRMPTRVTEIVIHFRPTPHHLFMSHTGMAHNSNKLVIRIQPDEGILMKFGMKIPGAGFQIQEVNMDFHYSDLANNKLPSAYERLLLDCMQGDATLYTRGDSLEAAWEFVMPILEYWKANPYEALHGYPAGTWGPENADNLIKSEGSSWRYPCKNLSDDGTYCEL